MASFSPGSSHLGVTDNQKRWLVAGIALNKILIPQIRPFVEQEVDKEYNNLKTRHNIHTQSTSGRLQRWPPRKFLKYENVNGNYLQPKLPGGRYNYSLFDCRVLSHVDFARLYVENYMAKFNAFDDRCDASAVLLLVGGVPVFSAAVQAAAGDVRTARNDWAHCVFSKWDPTKFQQSFIEMEHLVRVMALPAADEGKLLGELKDWETKGVQLCMNSPVDPALLQIVQQNIKSLQDDVNNMSVEFDQEKVKVQQELQNVATILKETRERIQRLEDKVDDFQADTSQIIGNLESRTGQVEGRVDNAENRMNDLKGDTNQRFESLEGRTGQVENQVHDLQEKFDDLTVKSQESATSCHDPSMAKPVANPEKFVELIRRDYKGAVLCPFPWCEDELQMKLSNIFTRLQIVSRTKERSKLTNDTVNMTDVFIPHSECINPRVVLIEGNPGMGKTTYCQKLAHDWSEGEIPSEASFPEVEMLLLLKCRDMHMKTANIEEAIDDQLLPQDADKKEKVNFFHYIRSNQSRILLVLDGLDELRQDLVQGFLPLIQGKVFSNIYLMLTARHEAGMRIRRYCDTLLEIVGYTHDDVDDYIGRYFGNHEDKSLAGKMINQLNEDEQLRELTINPLNTALLCLLYEETKGVFPSKRTKLYDDLVSCALRRYFAKRGVSLDDDDPLERCADQLNQLGRVAFEALLKNQMYFSQDEMKCRSEDFLQLCFLSREPSVSKIRPTPCYAFTHKTFQEYFAALYLSHLVFTGDKGKEKLLDQLSPFDNWQVWEFLFTMMASKSTEMAVIVVSRICASVFYHKRLQRLNDADIDLDVEICEEKPHDWTQCIGRLSVSKDEKALGVVLTKTLGLIAEFEDGDNELKEYQTKMVHVLAHCFPVKKLELKTETRYCSVYSEYLKFNRTLTDLLLNGPFNPLLLATIEHVFHSNLNLVHFSLCSVSYDPFIGVLFAPPKRDKAFSDLSQRILWMQLFGSKALLTEFLQSGRLLTHLNLSYVWISDGGTQVLADILQTNRALTHLNLHEALIFDFGARALGNVLQSNCTLTHLSLPENWISGTGTAFLARGLHSNPVLLYLDLSQNLGGDSVAVALAQALVSKCALKYLDLSQCLSCTEKNTPFADSDNVHVEMIGALGGSALAGALRLNCTLTYLDLQYNNIGDSGAIALGEALQTNCTLTELYLKDNKIGESGAEALGKALQSNRTLTHLCLDFNRDIRDSGAAAVAKALQSNGSLLTRLDLSFNKISSSGGIAIAEALQSNNSLTHLRLCQNKIKSSGAVAIAKALKSNRTLTHLGLSCNRFDDSGATELAQALQYYNNTLVYLDLRGNQSIGSIGRESLKQINQSYCIVKYEY